METSTSNVHSNRPSLHAVTGTMLLSLASCISSPSRAEEQSQRELLRHEIETEVMDQLAERWPSLRTLATQTADKEANKQLQTLFEAHQTEFVRAVVDAILTRESLQVAPELLKQRIDSALVSPEFLRIKQMKDATVLLQSDYSAGSGIIVYSGPMEDESTETVILTCWHVVRDILKSTTDENSGISTVLFQDGGKEEVLADMIASDKELDLALVRIRGPRKHTDSTPFFLPPTQLAEIVREGTKITTYGAQLGEEPFHSDGAISSTAMNVDEKNYYMINAPAYLGNSGAGVWHFIPVGDEKVPIGVYAGTFSKIFTSGRTVIPHMGLMNTPEAAYGFLQHNGFTPNNETLKLEFHKAQTDSPAKK